MTPRELSGPSVLAKLALIERLLRQLDGLGEISQDRLNSDDVVRLALERILTQLVETASSLNWHLGASVGEVPVTGAYKDSFNAAASAGAIPDELAQRLRPSAGLRNVLSHNYLAVDWGIVVASAPKMATDYRDYVRSVAQWLTGLGVVS